MNSHNSGSTSNIRSARIAGSISALKRRNHEKELDKLIAINETKDPFAMDGDNDLDIDYNPPKKSKKSSKSTRKDKSELSVAVRELSPKERIARLNEKTRNSKLHNTTLTPKHDSVIEVIHNTPNSLLDDNHDRFFQVDESIQMEPSNYVSSEKSIAESNSLSNKLIETKDNSMLSKSNMQFNAASGFKSISNESDMYLSLTDKMDKMFTELQSLRRQVARIEAKSIVGQSGERRITGNLDEDVFLNFESKLAEEGFPIQNVNGVVPLETKLRQSSFGSMPYRNKLVRIITVYYLRTSKCYMKIFLLTGFLIKCH